MKVRCIKESEFGFAGELGVIYECTIRPSSGEYELQGCVNRYSNCDHIVDPERFVIISELPPMPAQIDPYIEHAIKLQSLGVENRLRSIGNNLGNGEVRPLVANNSIDILDTDLLADDEDSNGHD